MLNPVPNLGEELGVVEGYKHLENRPYKKCNTWLYRKGRSRLSFLRRRRRLALSWDWGPYSWLCSEEGCTRYSTYWKISHTP